MSSQLLPLVLTLLLSQRHPMYDLQFVCQQRQLARLIYTGLPHAVVRSKCDASEMCWCLAGTLDVINNTHALW